MAGKRPPPQVLSMEHDTITVRASGLKPGTEYEFAVREVGSKDWSVPATGRTLEVEPSGSVA